MSLSTIDIIHDIRFDQKWTLKHIGRATPSTSNSTLLRTRNRLSFLSEVVISIFHERIRRHRCRNCSGYCCEYWGMFPYPVENWNPSGISIRIEEIIDRFFYSIVCILEYIHRNLIRDTHLYCSLIDSYIRTTIIASSIMYELLNI